MIDHKKIEQAVRLLLEGIGEDVNREGLLETPDRIARMYEEIYGGMEEDAGIHLSKTFTVESREMVIERISLFILPANIICSRFMEKLILRIFRMER